VARSMILIQTRNLPMATIKGPSRESRRPVWAASKKWQLHEGKEIRNGSLESGIRVRFEMELSRERLPNRVRPGPGDLVGARPLCLQKQPN
jgi:hypothetical protein